MDPPSRYARPSHDVWDPVPRGMQFADGVVACGLDLLTCLLRLYQQLAQAQNALGGVIERNRAFKRVPCFHDPSF